MTGWDALIELVVLAVCLWGATAFCQVVVPLGLLAWAVLLRARRDAYRSRACGMPVRVPPWWPMAAASVTTVLAFVLVALIGSGALVNLLVYAAGR